MNQYEAMFLFDPTFGGSFENCEKEVGRLMERAEAELLFCRKWDERRLAYKVKGRKRGVYVLTYFNASADRIVGLERDARLSEDVLRVLVRRADHVTPEMMERSVPTQRDREPAPEGQASEPGGVATAVAPAKTETETDREQAPQATESPAADGPAEATPEDDK